MDFDGQSPCQGDCDDRDATRFGGNSEDCDGVDNDCDGVTPDEQDDDGDGAPACADCDDSNEHVQGVDSDGDGVSPCRGDCDEGNASAFPGADDPYSDGIDQDCDGADGRDVDGALAARQAHLLGRSPSPCQRRWDLQIGPP